MGSYLIHFVNKFASASTNTDYVLFNDLPRLSHNPTGSPIYSNVFSSTTLTRNETWSIGLNKVHYAWCGSAQGKLEASTKVQISEAKLVALGTQSAAGTILQISSRNGRQTFSSDVRLSADFESFAIESGSDIDVNDNIVIGVATIDDTGVLKPLSTMDAASNANVNIAPSTKFCIAAHSSSVGTVFDSTILSQHAAAIDFSNRSDAYGAIVTHEENGSFSVKYTTQSAFAAAVEEAHVQHLQLQPSSSPLADARDTELVSLKLEIEKLQMLLTAALSTKPQAVLDSALDAVPRSITVAESNFDSTPVSITASPPPKVLLDPYPGKPITTWYKATLTFRNNPGQSRRRDVRDHLTTFMQARGYVYEGGSLDSTILVAMLSHHAGSYGAWHSVQQAYDDWRNGVDGLPKHMKGYVDVSHDSHVVRVPEAKGLWRARGETESRNGHANGVNGINVNVSNVDHPNDDGAANARRDTVRTATPTSISKPLTNSANTNGVKSNHHGRGSSTTCNVSRSTSNAIAVNGVKPVINGIHNSSHRKYDYPRGQDTAMEAAKRRARAVLVSEGLTEFANGWKVSGY